MKQHRILLVEDEPFLGKVVAESLQKENYEVDWLVDGTAALGNFAPNKYDICILDVMLPGTDGFTLAAKIRRADAAIPILFLTARDGIDDLKTGYASGGNDYLRKPFSLDELFLRIGQLLNHSASAAEAAIGNILFYTKRQELSLPEGKRIKLSHREAGLLQLLLENKNEVTQRRRALLALWGDDSFFHARSMDVYVTRLRKKLASDPSVEIVNIRDYGYKLIC